MGVPVAGWAVGAGILVGVGASVLFANTGVDEAIGDAAEGAWNGVKNGAGAVRDFIGGWF